MLLTGGGDRTARVWDTATGDLRSCLAGHGGSVKSCKFWERQPNVVVTGSRDGCVRVRSRSVP